jgi:hypothetical protein
MRLEEEAFNAKLIKTSNKKFDYLLNTKAYLSIDECIYFTRDTDGCFFSSKIIEHKFEDNLLYVYTLNSQYIFEVFKDINIVYTKPAECYIKFDRYIKSLKSNQYIFVHRFFLNTIIVSGEEAVSFENAHTLLSKEQSKEYDVLIPCFSSGYFLDFKIKEIDNINYLSVDEFRCLDIYECIERNLQFYTFDGIEHIKQDEFEQILYNMET